MQTLQVIVILAIFLAGVALMMTKKMPAILALPCMGDVAGKACAAAHTKQVALSKFDGKNLI